MIKHLSTAIVLAMSAAGASAAPYCEDLLNPNVKVEKKFKKRIPMLSDVDSGWAIIPKNMGANLAPKDSAKYLVKEIVAEFKSRGTNLAVVMPPPRSLFIPEDVVKGFGPEGADYDHAAVRKDYQAAVQAWQDAGAYAGDYSNLLENPMADQMYNRADIHWTVTAASFVANDLAQGISGTTFEMPALDKKWESKLILSEVVNAVCGFDVPSETYMHFDEKVSYGLLDEVVAKIGYAGTSFSSADKLYIPAKLEYFLKTPMADFSGNGYGMAGGILALLTHAKTEDVSYETVVWEYPYIYSLNEVGSLRQVLGTLESMDNAAPEHSVTVKYSKKSKEVKLPKPLKDYEYLELIPGIDKVEKMYIAFKLDGKRQKFTVRRSKRLPQDIRPDSFYFSLSGLDVDGITDLRISFPKNVKANKTEVLAKLR